jgi:hypothetical protein
MVHIRARCRQQTVPFLQPGRRAPPSADVAATDHVLDRYIPVLDVRDSTRETSEGCVNKHVRPALGKLQAGRVDGETLDSFYAELRRDYCGRGHACKPWRRPQSARSTGSCPGPLSGRSGGRGWQ